MQADCGPKGGTGSLEERQGKGAKGDAALVAKVASRRDEYRKETGWGLSGEVPFPV